MPGGGNSDDRACATINKPERGLGRPRPPSAVALPAVTPPSPPGTGLRRLGRPSPLGAYLHPFSPVLPRGICTPSLLFARRFGGLIGARAAFFYLFIPLIGFSLSAFSFASSQQLFENVFHPSALPNLVPSYVSELLESEGCLCRV